MSDTYCFLEQETCLRCFKQVCLGTYTEWILSSNSSNNNNSYEDAAAVAAASADDDDAFISRGNFI